MNKREFFAKIYTLEARVSALETRVGQLRDRLAVYGAMARRANKRIDPRSASRAPETGAGNDVL